MTALKRFLKIKKVFRYTKNVITVGIISCLIPTFLYFMFGIEVKWIIALALSVGTASTVYVIAAAVCWCIETALFFLAERKRGA